MIILTVSMIKILRKAFDKCFKPFFACCTTSNFFFTHFYLKKKKPKAFSAQPTNYLCVWIVSKMLGKNVRARLIKCGFYNNNNNNNGVNVRFSGDIRQRFLRGSAIIATEWNSQPSSRQKILIYSSKLQCTRRYTSVTVLHIKWQFVG